jgi:two-component system, OmpR family, response regulator CpxR
MSKTILIVDDDVELCSLMKDFFAQQGFRTVCAHDGQAGLVRALEGGFDLLILDAMLPVLDGFELLRLLRKQSAIPVIMLTARTAQHDRIKGLDAGADDYLPKPFGPEELAARVRAVLRRMGKAETLKADVMESGGLRLDARAREVRYFGESVDFTSVEFDILELLMRAAGRIVSRDELAVILYQRRSTPYERSLDVHISHLRKKLELVQGRNRQANAKPVIRTVRGIGYMFSTSKT